jgi:ABC-type transport system involved in multi-copper enzyme maturation permease subunit
MSGFSTHFGLPLLTKELLEQSARKRTYLLRTIYAIALYATTLWAFYRQDGSLNGSGFSILGNGRQLYLSLAWFEFAGIYVFLPAMTSSVLTAEKERDTLGLLLLTKLGPWTIVFEKLFSRLIPMASFVLLSLPLLAVAYGLGGIEAVDIAKLMWVLAITALQVGTFAVLCSAWFRTTAAAFLATYLLGAVSIVVSALVYLFLLRTAFEFWFTYLLSGPAVKWLFDPKHPNIVVMAFGPSILNGDELGRNGSTNLIFIEQTFLDCVVMTIPLFTTSVLSLTFARVILWRRAFVEPKNYLLKVFKSLDVLFHQANHNRLTRGIVLIRESVALPEYQPISWRETSKRSLGTTRYLVRFLLMVEFPVMAMAFWPASENVIHSGFAPVYVAGWCLWLVATLVLSIQATGLIGVERSHQSLDVLLTTPIESDEIVRQKFAGVWRMIHVLWVPFATLYLFQAWWETWIGLATPHRQGSSGDGIMFTVLRAVLAVGLYLPTIAWFGFYQGLRCRSQTHAILVTMTVITLACVAPPSISCLLTPQYPQFYQGGPSTISLISWLSPAVVLSAQPWNAASWFLMIVHFLGVAAVNLWFVAIAKQSFARRVGRNDGIFTDENEAPLAALSREDRLARLRRGGVGVRVLDDLDATDKI